MPPSSTAPFVSWECQFYFGSQVVRKWKKSFEELRLLLVTKWSVETVKMFSKAWHLQEKWKFHKLNNGHRYTLMATEMWGAFWNRSLRWEKFPCWDAFLWRLQNENRKRFDPFPFPHSPKSPCFRFRFHLLKSRNLKVNMKPKGSDLEKDTY